MGGFDAVIAYQPPAAAGGKQPAGFALDLQIPVCYYLCLHYPWVLVVWADLLTLPLLNTT